ncbi:MAG: phage terminase large subunit [Nitrospinae bacterium]|nr:phage terminase large subunit [Nitrospinota bacterium]
MADGYAEIRAAIAKAITPFGKTTPRQKETRKKRAQKELRFFAETYFPHYLTAPPSKMHLHFYQLFQEAIDRAHSKSKTAAHTLPARIAQAAPRGHAKSTISSLILPLWCVVSEKRRFIALVSDTTEQAADFLEFIKAELDANQRLMEDFPEACGEGRVWKAGQAITRNNVRLKCWGKRKAMRGARHGSVRPDLIVCDDLEGDENIASPQQRAKDREWFFKALMKIGSRRTVTLVVGTLLHYDSLLAQLLQRPGWSGRKWQAVQQWSASPLWEQWESAYVARREEQADRFFKKHQRAMLDGTDVLWPEVEDYYYLMKMRVSDGPAFFDSEKQNEPVNPDDCLFKEEWLTFLDEERVLRNLEWKYYRGIYCAVDPSLGKQSKGADPSAIIVAGVDTEGYIDVLEADIRKRPPDAIMEDLFALHKKYRFTLAGIEEIQFQEMFKDWVIKESTKRGLYLPVEGIRPNSDKVLRISKMQPHIKNGIIRFRRNQTQLIDQLKYFPKADHDDVPDALEMVFSLITHHTTFGPRIRKLFV